jgi:AmiR/NasT family two-component response regulator
VLIEQAKGLLAGELHISVDDAWTIARDHARGRSASARSVAQAIVELGMRP